MRLSLEIVEVEHDVQIKSDSVVEGEEEQEKDELDEKNDVDTARASQSTATGERGNYRPSSLCSGCVTIRPLNHY
jgi:hypothetical protein